MKKPRLALIGATGIVGRTTLDVFKEWNTPLAELRLFSSSDSSGTVIEFRGKQLLVEELVDIPQDVDTAILATSSKLSELWAPKLKHAGITVIDHSSRFRMQDDVPLVIPEINADTLKNHHGLIANPNCSASVILLPLFGLHRRFGIEQIVVSTYQSVSGAGKAAIEELEQQLADKSAKPSVFPVPIAGNVIPRIGSFNKEGVSGEEEKIGDEIRKILRAPEIHVLSTTVRVPVFVGHSASVTVRIAERASIEEIYDSLTGIAGLVFEQNHFRTPLEIAGKQEVFVSRIRQDGSHPEWIQFWVVGDNLRKGAASNAVQILQELFS
ncbi:aspartate-semialdehyde dehydrogenase [bacterium]|nr:aspartate-semialdehyde dehydrogenase [bacterium]MBU1637029.1 aspartate-semialdehyde dehydrogenase [bacterium]MBU1921246.1 aspartate-semialdehyde dehydrogenase [bacterium]